jgi:hypothetical protein
VERRIWKFIKGASPGEPSLAGFGGGVRVRGKPKPASLGDREQGKEIFLDKKNVENKIQDG